MTSIKNLLKSKETDLKNKLQTVINHPTSKGDNSEESWIIFFRSFLPSKYAVDKGFVFDSKGEMSQQIDVIIYDSLYTPLIFETEGGEKFITAESVYAVFEVKQKINKQFLGYANEKIESVQKLYRSSRSIIVAGKTVQPRELTKIIGGILSINSISIKSLEAHLHDYTSIDLGCAINKFSFLTTRDKAGNITKFEESKESEVILSFFYIILDELYRIGTIGAIDIRDYSDFSLSSIKLRRGE